MAVGKANFGGTSKLIASGTVSAVGGSITITGLTFKPVEILAWVGSNTSTFNNGEPCIYYDDTIFNTGKGSINIGFTGAGTIANPYTSVTASGFSCAGYLWSTQTITWIAKG